MLWQGLQAMALDIIMANTGTTDTTTATTMVIDHTVLHSTSM